MPGTEKSPYGFQIDAEMPIGKLFDQITRYVTKTARLKAEIAELQAKIAALKPKENKPAEPP